MTTQEIIKMLISIRKDADRLHSGNVAHQRVHMIGDLQWLIDELSKANSSNTRTEPALPIQSVETSKTNETAQLGIGAVMCRFFGHKYRLKRHITPYLREIKCTRCKQEFGMNDQTQSVLPLDNELRELHRVL